jgi:hypothetical protein
MPSSSRSRGRTANRGRARAAVEAIGRFYPNDDKALDELVRIARTHPSRDTRSAAVEMVGRLDQSARAPDARRDHRRRERRRNRSGTRSRASAAATRGHRQPPARDRAHAPLDRGAASGGRELGRRDGNADRMLSIAKSDVPEDVQRPGRREPRTQSTTRA